MKGFVQLMRFDNTRVAIAVDKIIAVSEEEEGSFVTTKQDKKGLRGAFVKENYDQVIEKIEEAG